MEFGLRLAIRAIPHFDQLLIRLRQSSENSTSPVYPPICSNSNVWCLPFVGLQSWTCSTLVRSGQLPFVLFYVSSLFFFQSMTFYWRFSNAVNTRSALHTVFMAARWILLQTLYGDFPCCSLLFTKIYNTPWIISSVIPSSLHVENSQLDLDYKQIINRYDFHYQWKCAQFKPDIRYSLNKHQITLKRMPNYYKNVKNNSPQAISIKFLINAKAQEIIKLIKSPLRSFYENETTYNIPEMTPIRSKIDSTHRFSCTHYPLIINNSRV